MDNDGNPGVAPRRRSRDKTNMQDFLERTKKTRRFIEFTDLGAPTGEFGANFSSYLGWYLRETVPCTILDWKHADQESIKDPVWNHMKVQSCTNHKNYRFF